jgi:Lrp/AsnC family leucine-responsive transcriptional regulator
MDGMPSKPSQNGHVAEQGLLDAVNLRLIEELQGDARLSVAELGRRIALSGPAVAERLRRLEEAGVIAGYQAVVDPRRLGYGFGVVMRIRPVGAKLVLVAEILRATPEVVECHRVTGDDCYVAIAYVRDVEHLEQVIDRFTPHGSTTTSIMQSSPVPRRPVVPPATAAAERFQNG